MKTAAVVRYFGSKYRLAKAIGVEPPVVYRWGKIVPAFRQVQIEHVTKGHFKVTGNLVSKLPQLEERPPRRKRRRNTARLQEAPPAPATALPEASDA